MRTEVTTASQPLSATARPSRGTASRFDLRTQTYSAADDGESAAKYLFRLSHDVILSLDRVGNILCTNQRGVQLSGYSESELRAANVFELLLFPEDRQIARAMLADVVACEARGDQVAW